MQAHKQLHSRTMGVTTAGGANRNIGDGECSAGDKRQVGELKRQKPAALVGDGRTFNEPRAAVKEVDHVSAFEEAWDFGRGESGRIG